MSIKRQWLSGLILLNFAGAPTVELKDGNTRPPLKENFNITSDTYIHTHANEYATIKINDIYQALILPDTHFTIEGVKQKDKFDVRSIRLISGKIHFFEPAREVPEKLFFKNQDPNFVEPQFEAIKIDSNFFSILTREDQRLSLLIDVNPKTAILEVCNYNAELKLDLFNHEVSQIIKTNEVVKFQGVLDAEGKIAYDMLLEKRKIPQGKWLPKKSCSAEEVQRVLQAAEKNQLSEFSKKNKIKNAQIAQKKKDDAHFLCHRPYGQLNQCHFKLEQKKCLRQRCNAEGKWAEPAELGVSSKLCTVKGDVRACGY